jgi:superfamily I DNA/RNA helicase
MVYDPRQMIYGFRHAAGAAGVEAHPAIATLTLSQTWRYGEPLASAAAQLVRALTGDLAFRITPAPGRATDLLHAAAPPYRAVCGRGLQLVVLARNNEMLLAEALSAVASGAVARVHGSFFERMGGPELLLDLYTLWRGGGADAMHRTDHLVARCADSGGGYLACVRAASAQGDTGLLQAIRLLRRHGAGVPGLVNQLLSASTADAGQAQAVYTTGHRAKGCGWDIVYLCPDFMAGGASPSAAARRAQRRVPRLRMADVCRNPAALLRAAGYDVQEEGNVLYVAMTRAKRLLIVHTVVAAWLAEAGVPVGRMHQT